MTRSLMTQLNIIFVGILQKFGTYYNLERHFNWNLPFQKFSKLYLYLDLKFSDNRMEIPAKARFLVSAVGIFVCYFYFGILQERM